MRVHRTSTGLVDRFAAAGMLQAADVHVSRTLMRLTGEQDERVGLAAALAVRAVREGSVCVDLASVGLVIGESDGTDPGPGEAGGQPAEDTNVDELPTLPGVEEWVSACRDSPAVGGDGPEAVPLRLRGTLLYLDRYWREEHLVRAALDSWGRRSQPQVDTDHLRRVLAVLFPGPAPDYQRLAAAAAATGWFTVVAGGPGTGKTTTVARLLAVMQALAPAPLRIALAAPTGKAAARLQEAVSGELERAALQLADRGDAAPVPPTASTVHRLLGARPDSGTRFWHHRGNRLPYDVVVVDEASMMSLTLVARLVEALRPDTRLVLVGDPDQLVSVEAGAVLGDIAARPPREETDARAAVLAEVVPEDMAAAAEVGPQLRSDLVRLRRNYRFEDAAGLVRLAEAVRQGDPDAAVLALRTAEETVQWVECDAAEVTEEDVAGLRAVVVESGQQVLRAAEAADAAAALTAAAAHRLLCAHREGPYGVARWRVEVQRWLQGSVPGYGAGGEFYLGRPLLVTSNDDESGLFNGDTGVVVRHGDGVVAAFGPDGPVLDVAQLPAVDTPYAMTVHKAQGSEADRVTVVLPPPRSPLLTRELLYTAITRARSRVCLIGTEESLRRAVTRPIVRASGLRRV